MTTPSSHETRQKAAAMRAAHALASFEEILEVVARNRSNPVAAGRALQQIEDLARRAIQVAKSRPPSVDGDGSKAQ